MSKDGGCLSVSYRTRTYSLGLDSAEGLQVLGLSLVPILLYYLERLVRGAAVIGFFQPTPPI